MQNALTSLAWVCLPFALLSITACKKEDAKDTCFYSPAPRVTYNSWPSSLSTDSAYSVVRSNIPLDVYAMADASGDQDDLRLTSLIIRIIADANDSVLYAEDRAPDAFNGSFTSTVSLDPIPANIPATLRITATNKCGFSDAVLRHLLVMPD